MSSEKVQFAHRWFEEVWNKVNLDAVDEMFAADGIARGLGEHGVDVIGPTDFKPFLARLLEAFPDIKFTVDGTVEEGDQIAIRFTVTMTHTGDALGVPATGRQAQVQGISVSRLRDGQIVEAWNNWDIYGLMQQLNAPPDRVKLLD